MENPDPLKELLNQGLSVTSDDPDCQKIICMDESDALKKYQRNASKNHGFNQTRGHDCPLTRQSMGRYSWSLLHTYAAYYPNQPSDHDKSSMLAFLTGFRNLYPCTHCRAHFNKSVEEGSTDVTQISLALKARRS